MVRYSPHVPPLFLVREAPPSVRADPFQDAEALEDLGERIAVLAAHIHAATHRLLTLVADFDRRRGWELGGHRSCAHWLSFRTGIDLGAAREKVRTARALVDLPETCASMARGELSFSAVRALTRVALAENESELLELARGCTITQLERLVRGWKVGSRKDEATRERERHESRTLSVFPDEDGMYVVKGRLDPEVGALLMRAIEAAGDALFREESWSAAGAERDKDTARAAARRRADAMGLLAERALAAGFGSKGAAGSDGERGETVSGTRASRYQVTLHVDLDTLSADGEPGRSELEDGTRVSAETSRRFACDSGIVRVAHGSEGSVLDVGRRTRSIPPALRRALEARDQGCRFPGCGLRFAEGHHVRHWADGGETSLGNCLLLCRHHHRLVHEGGWSVEWWGEGRPVFLDPRGHVNFDGRWVPPDHPEPSSLPGASSLPTLREPPTLRDPLAPPSLPVLPDRPVESLIEEHRRMGVDPDGWTASPRWKREDDIPDEVFFGAMEAFG